MPTTFIFFIIFLFFFIIFFWYMPLPSSAHIRHNLLLHWAILRPLIYAPTNAYGYHIQPCGVMMCLFYIGVSMPDWYRDTCPTHRTYPSQSPIIQWSSKHSFISLSSGFVLIIKHSLSEWFCLLWASHTGYFGFLRPTLHIDWYSRIIGIFSE